MIVMMVIVKGEQFSLSLSWACAKMAKKGCG